MNSPLASVLELESLVIILKFSKWVVKAAYYEQSKNRKKFALLAGCCFMSPFYKDTGHYRQCFKEIIVYVITVIITVMQLKIGIY